MFSGNEFNVCAPNDLGYSFQTLLRFGIEHKDCLFCELDLENDYLFFSLSLDFGYLKS